jgi:transposase InsO family protein
MWEKLKEDNKGMKLMHAMTLKKQLFRIQQEEEESLMKLLERVENLCLKIEALGEESLRERDRCFLIVGALNQKFDSVSQNICLNSQEKLTLERIRDIFLLEDQRGETRKNEEIKKNGIAYTITNLKKCRTFNCNRLPEGNFPSCKECYLAWRKTIEEKKKKEKKEKEKEKGSTTVYNTEINQNNTWYIDSACTRHITNDISDLRNLRISMIEIEGPTSEKAEAKGEGTAVLNITNGNEKRVEVFLERTLFVPNVKRKLISVPTLVENGYRVVFADKRCEIFKNNKIVISGVLDDEVGLFKVTSEISNFRNAIALNSTIKTDHIKNWHEKLGHASKYQLKYLSERGIIKDFDQKEVENYILECTTCERGKMPRKSFAKVKLRGATEIGEVIHTDVCGPIFPTALGGYKYFITFTDDFTRFIWVTLIKHKNEAFEIFKDLYNIIKTQHSKKIKKLVSDGGGEYISYEFDQYLKRKGIEKEKTPRNTPQLNGVAERLNRTLMNMVRTMLKDKNLSNRLWGEALIYATKITNRMWKKKTGKIPYEQIKGKVPDLSNYKVFGISCMHHNNEEHLRKLDDRAFPGLFCGINNEETAYRIYDINKKTIIISRDVRFYEKGEINFKIDFPIEELIVFEEEEEEKCDNTPNGFTIEAEMEENFNEKSNDNLVEAMESKIEEEVEGEEEDERIGKETEGVQEIRRSGRRRGYSAPKREDRDFWKKTNVLNLEVPRKGPINIPKSFKEAISSEESDKWLDAIGKEKESLSKMGTWELVRRPDSKPVVKNKWVFDIKTNEVGEIVRYKARLVAKGFTQTYGVDYRETFAPVLRTESLRYLIAYAAENNLEIHHMDVETAFLNGELNEEIYMELPEGYEGDKQNSVCKLNKTLYGLKQASREWNVKFTQELKDQGFEQTMTDPCVFTRGVGPEKVLLGVFVDDNIIVGRSQNIIEAKHILNNLFKMKDLGELKKIVGIRVANEEKRITLDQEEYIQDLLARFGMENCKPISTPMGVQNKGYIQDEKPFENERLFKQLIGSLIYLSNSTRPDICFSVNQLARNMQKPRMEDWKSGKRILRYLQGTKDIKLIYSKEKSELCGFSDASYAEDKKDRHSTSGQVHLKNGGAISWKSKKQKIVSLSSMEAEYIALTDATKEGIWLKKMEKELNGNQTILTIYEDNQSAIKTANNKIHNDRSKHIDVRFHFIREKIENGELKLVYCPTEYMVADIMTKALGKVAHVRLRMAMGLH